MESDRMTGGVKNAKKESKIHEAVRANYSDLLDGLKAPLPRLFSFLACLFCPPTCVCCCKLFPSKVSVFDTPAAGSYRSPLPIPHSPLPFSIPPSILKFRSSFNWEKCHFRFASVHTAAEHKSVTEVAETSSIFPAHFPPTLVAAAEAQVLINLGAGTKF